MRRNAMRMRDRSAIVLIIVAIALFAINWPINNYISNPQTWHSHQQKKKDAYGKYQLVAWRPPQNEGETFFNSIFRGGGGTPAILAMFGGQRYMIANIMWNYADILFHEGKIYDMPNVLEATVTLNPSFTEAWSMHGWHLAWNLNADTTNQILKALYLEQGENVYRRAILANPDKPRPYFDMAWLYLSRTFEYKKAMFYLEKMVNEFEPLTPKDKKKRFQNPLDIDRKWDPKVVGMRLAYVYKKEGIAEKNWDYIQRSIDMYQKCLDVDPADESAQHNLKTLKKNLHNEAWMKEEYQKEEQLRTIYGQTSLSEYVKELQPLAAHEGGDDQEGHDH